nr:MAG TPA: hypothetical protein [Microviridae sp.]
MVSLSTIISRNMIVLRFHQVYFRSSRLRL